MKAVVFKGPFQIAIEERPIPKIQDAKDIIVKVAKACTIPDMYFVSDVHTC